MVLCKYYYNYICTSSHSRKLNFTSSKNLKIVVVLRNESIVPGTVSFSYSFEIEHNINQLVAAKVSWLQYGHTYVSYYSGFLISVELYACYGRNKHNKTRLRVENKIPELDSETADSIDRSVLYGTVPSTSSVSSNKKKLDFSEVVIG